MNAEPDDDGARPEAPGGGRRRERPISPALLKAAALAVIDASHDTGDPPPDFIYEMAGVPRPADG